MAKLKNNEVKTAYLTKRILVSRARASGVKASKEAMALMGYVIVSDNGWIVKKYADGSKEKIKKSTPVKTLNLSPIKTKKPPQLRLRVFAGPNGSGKSTVINAVKAYRSNKKPIDFGYYINADEIADSLRGKGLSFNQYDIKVSNKEFQNIAINSGLINEEFSEETFTKCYFLRKNVIKLKTKDDQRLAQIIADFLRKKLLEERKRFSFETVFSHTSKLDIMKQAAAAGYKVYLYFVSTESPAINQYRVDLRV